MECRSYVERADVEDMVELSQIRCKVIIDFEMLRNKVDRNLKKKHGNIPL